MASENFVVKALDVIWNESKDLYNKKVPSFFAPYSSGKDIALSLSAPLYAPFALALGTAVAGVIAALTAVVCAASYLTAGVASVVGKSKFAREVRDIGNFCGMVACVTAILFPCCALLGVISLPYTLAHLTTRTGTTVVSKFIDSCSPETTYKETIGSQLA
ncbi:hypothetical protein [Legionella hackeliae]|nr:hypothetical protein [Legionella hackeliae]